MTQASHIADLVKQRRRPRHHLATRLWHWFNALSVIILFMSGLNIANAHPRLYWGEWGFERDQAWFAHVRFPGWATIPDHYSLAAARDWHFLFALVFAFGFLAYLIASIANGHLRRDLFAGRHEWRPRAIAAAARAHLRLRFDHGGAKYNPAQKLVYALVIFVGLPVMIFSGMALAPGMEAAWPWLGQMFGGRQSARSIHFIIAFGLCAFLLVHVVMVLLSGPWRQLRAMIGGGCEDRAP